MREHTDANHILTGNVFRMKKNEIQGLGAASRAASPFVKTNAQRPLAKRQTMHTAALSVKSSIF